MRLQSKRPISVATSKTVARSPLQSHGLSVNFSLILNSFGFVRYTRCVARFFTGSFAASNMRDHRISSRRPSDGWLISNSLQPIAPTTVHFWIQYYPFQALLDRRSWKTAFQPKIRYGPVTVQLLHQRMIDTTASMVRSSRTFYWP